MEEGALRTFIAIELPDNIKAELSRIIEGLKKPRFGFVRWVNPQNIHLTLKFLGNVEAAKIDCICDAVRLSADGGEKFSLELSGLGFFPNPRRPRVFWIGIAGDLDRLLHLQGSIDRNTEKLGFPGEKRPFSPHITLARINEDAMLPDLVDFVKATEKVRLEKKLHIDVDRALLMRSQLFRTGARYTRLFEAKITG
jgi:RNA 2',3'-cyclic 3'-phosphodiesterase